MAGGDCPNAASANWPARPSRTQGMARSTVTSNLIANFAGKAWTSALGFLFLPVYVRLMGIEAYGLIGVFVSLTALLSILDLGLSSTLSRELARLSVSDSREAAGESRDLARTLEIIFWGAGAVIGVAVVALAPTVATRWIAQSGLPDRTVRQAVAIMGLVIAIQWPSSVYDGGLAGLQRQRLLNLVRATIATVQHAGAILVLWFLSRSIVAYFVWQIAVQVLQTLVLRQSLWRSLPTASRRGAFRSELMRKHSAFAAGMTGISVMGVILTQADKLVLSKLLPLAEFGYYMVAFNLANMMLLLVTPVFAALFPRFAQLFATGDADASLSALYHAACQVVSAIVLPAAAIIVFFPAEVLLLWTRDPRIVENSAQLTRFLVIGSALNALVFIPFVVQIASGWTRLTFLWNVVAVLVLVPLMVVLVRRHGAIGGAIAWMLLNASYLVAYIPIMHRRLLRGRMWRWYLEDVGKPLVVVLGVVSASRALMPSGPSPGTALAWIAATSVTALVAASLAVPITRAWIARSSTA